LFVETEPADEKSLKKSREKPSRSWSAPGIEVTHTWGVNGATQELGKV
jgi:hypothetical protein